MDVYLDLSLLLLLIEIMVCIYSLELLLAYREKRSVKITLILVNLILFFTYKTTFIISLFCFILINSLVFIILSNKWKSKLAIFTFTFFIINFFISVLNDDMEMLTIFLIIKNPQGIVYSLLIPLFGIFLYLATRFVDTIFHLHCFKTTCVISKDDKNVSYQAYFDSGNTLKYDNVPVIFCLKSSWLFSTNEKVNIDLSTISGGGSYEAYRALIKVDANKEEYYVYVVLVEQSNNFNGCEILLNAYLR